MNKSGHMERPLDLWQPLILQQVVRVQTMLSKAFMEDGVTKPALSEIKGLLERGVKPKKNPAGPQPVGSPAVEQRRWHWSSGTR